MHEHLKMADVQCIMSWQKPYKLINVLSLKSLTKLQIWAKIPLKFEYDSFAQ